MNNKDIENKISSAIDDMIPNDTYDKISHAVSALPRTERKKIMKNTANRFKKFAIGAVAACLVLTSGIFAGSYYSNNIKVDSVVDIDVNPSIELLVNKKDVVLEVKAVNADAKNVLDGMNLEKTELKVAVNAIIGSMVKQGYIKDDASGILVTVKNDDEAKAHKIRNEIITDIDASLDTKGINASVITHTTAKHSEAEKFAEDNGISFGKAVFILNLAGKDGSLTPTELAKLSLKEIVDLVKKNNINITDIVDYDADDSLWENIKDDIEDKNEDKYGDGDDKIPDGNYITSDAAKSAALTHAGVANDKILKIEVKLENENGKIVYEVDFETAEFEYDYEIDAVNGSVIKSEKEANDDNQSVTPPVTNPPATSDDKITPAHAKEIALAHAGLSGEKVTFIKVEYDIDDGVAEYEVEFYYGGFEYEYEINAKTGNIISHEKERD